MENFLKNTVKLCDVDSLIDKFNRELSKDAEPEDTRRLTIESPNRSNRQEAIDGINSKIFDLENLIKRLQCEIDGMCDKADHKVTETLSQQTVVADKTKLHKEGTTSHTYPLILTDIDLPLAKQSNDFKNEKDHLLNYGRPKSKESLSSIGKHFAILWNDEDDVTNMVKGSDSNNCSKS